jgi:hypothetical protein
MMSLVPPNRIVIDFLEGVTNKADAVAYARGFITSHFEVPEQSGYYVQALKDGFAYEVHEGGSRRAFLPAILKQIENDSNATISVRSGSRVLQVSKSPRGSFNAVLLPEELSSYLENVLEPDAKAPALTPFQMDNMVWLFIGLGMAGLGLLIFVLSLAFFAFDAVLSKPAKINITAADKLPIAQWESMIAKLDGHNYISAMRYENGMWRFETKSNPTGEETAAESEGPEKKPSGILPPLPTPPANANPNAAAPVPPPSPTGLPSTEGTP